MDREVLVPLLKAVVLADVMQVVTSDDNGPLHLHFGHHTFRQTMDSILCYTTFSSHKMALDRFRKLLLELLSLDYISVAIRHCRQNPKGLEDHREISIICRTVTKKEDMWFLVNYTVLVSFKTKLSLGRL